MNFDVESEDFNTIGGYVFGLLGRTPVLDDEVTFQGLQARVVELDGRRIARLVLSPVRDLESEGHENSTTGEDSSSPPTNL